MGGFIDWSDLSTLWEMRLQQIGDKVWNDIVDWILFFCFLLFFVGLCVLGLAFSASSSLYYGCQQLKKLYSFRFMSSGRVIDLSPVFLTKQVYFRPLQRDSLTSLAQVTFLLSWDLTGGITLQQWTKVRKEWHPLHPPPSTYRISCQKREWGDK